MRNAPFVRWHVTLLWLVLASAAITHCSLLVQHAEALQISAARLNSAGNIEVNYLSSSSNYYVLYRGDSVLSISSPASAVLGQTSAGVLSDRSPPASNRFYRLAQISTNEPIDLDADGIDDVYELNHASALDPLDPSDALNDADGDRFSNSREYLTGTDPLFGEPTVYIVDEPGSGSMMEFREVMEGIARLNTTVPEGRQGRLVIATERVLSVSTLEISAAITFDVAEPFQGKARLAGPPAGSILINAVSTIGLNGIAIQGLGGVALNSGRGLHLRGNSFPSTTVRIGSSSIGGGDSLPLQSRAGSGGSSSFFKDNTFLQMLKFECHTATDSSSSIRFHNNAAPKMMAEFTGTVGGSVEFKANVLKELELSVAALADASVSLIGQQAMDRLEVSGFLAGNPQVKLERNFALSTALDFKGPGQLYAYLNAHEAQTFNLDLGTTAATVESQNMKVHGDMYLNLRDGDVSVGKVDMKNSSVEVGGGYFVNMLEAENASLDLALGIEANRFEGMLQGSARFQLSEDTSIRAGFSAEIYKGITELRSAGASLYGGIFLEYKGLEAGFSGVFEAGEISGDVTLDAPQGAGLLMIKLDGCNFLGGGTLGCWGPEKEGGNLRAAGARPNQEIVLTGIQNGPGEIEIFDLEASVTIENCQFTSGTGDIQIVNSGAVTVKQVSVTAGDLGIHDDDKQVEVTVEDVTIKGDISVIAGSGSIKNCSIDAGELRADFANAGTIENNTVAGGLGTVLGVDGGTVEVSENTVTGVSSFGSAAGGSEITARQNQFGGILSVAGGRVTANANTYREAIFISNPGVLILNGGNLSGIEIYDFNMAGGLGVDPVTLGADPNKVFTNVDFDNDGCGDYPPPQRVPVIGCVRTGVPPPK